MFCAPESWAKLRPEVGQAGPGFFEQSKRLGWEAGSFGSGTTMFCMCEGPYFFGGRGGERRPRAWNTYASDSERLLILLLGPRIRSHGASSLLLAQMLPVGSDFSFFLLRPLVVSKGNRFHYWTFLFSYFFCWTKKQMEVSQ